MPNRFRFFILFSLLMTPLLLLWSSACSSGPDPNVIRDPGIGLCETDSDCVLQGQHCYRRYCRASSAVTGDRYSLQLIPPKNLSTYSEKPLIRQQFIGIRLSELHDRTVWLRESYSIKGSIRTTTGEAVAARLLFVDTESIPGQLQSYEVKNKAAEDPNRQGSDYEAHLTFGIYDLEIQPEDKRLPPFRMTRISITRPQTLDITLPTHHLTDLTKDAYIRIEGQLAQHAQLAKMPQGFAYSDLQIDALAEDQSVISGLGDVAADGRFSLRLQTPIEGDRLISHPTILRIRQRDRREKNGTRWIVPEIRIPLQTTGKIKDRQIALGLLPFVYAQEPSLLQGRIQSRHQEGAMPCAACSLTLRGEMTLGHHLDQPIQASFRFDENTDSNGTYNIAYLDGSYQLEVVPNVTSRWARAVYQSHSIRADRLDITLETKPALRGRVCAQNGDENCLHRVAATQIRALWRAPQTINSTSQSLQATQYQTQLSEQDGSFELQLDPGIYDLLFIPPEGSKLARALKREVTVDRIPLDLQATLPKAQFLIAQIVTPNGFPLEGVTVELYSFNESSKSPPHTIGRHTTNNLGLFSIAYDPNPTP